MVRHQEGEPHHANGHECILSFQVFQFDHSQQECQDRKTEFEKSVAKSLTVDIHYNAAEKGKNRKQPKKSVAEIYFYNYSNLKQPIFVRFSVVNLTHSNPNRVLKIEPRNIKSVLWFWHSVDHSQGSKD